MQEARRKGDGRVGHGREEQAEGTVQQSLADDLTRGGKEQ